MDWNMITAAGSFIVAATALFYTRRSRTVDDARYASEREDDADKRARTVAAAVCHDAQGRYREEARAEFRRVFERLDELAQGQAELRGALSGIHASVNGGLEARLTRAVRAALDKEGA